MAGVVRKILSVFLCLIFLIGDVYALGYEGVRDSSFSATDTSFCETGDLGGFDPLGVTARDLRWVVTNPTCYGFIAGVGATMLTLHVAGRFACAQNPVAFPFNGAISRSSSIPAAAILNVNTGLAVAAFVSDCGEKVALWSAANATNTTPPTTGTYTAQVGAASTSMSYCCASSASYVAAVGVALGVLASLWDVASETYENARVCGHDWYSWKQFDVNGNPVTGTVSTATGGYWRRGAYDHSYAKKLQDTFIPSSPSASTPPSWMDDERSLTNMYYREFMFNGKEYRDSSGPCRPPSNWNSTRQVELLGYTDDKQRYYMRGPGLPSYFACHRYISTGTATAPTSAERDAYECCVERSQSVMCIENRTRLGRAGNMNISGSGWNARVTMNNGYNSAFCKVGESCMVSAVGFKVENSMSQISTICAQTETLCPYDHLLGGGTEIKSYGTSTSGSVISTKINNYCQFNKHCVKTPARPYVRITDFNNAFISGACVNFVGHSQNTYSNTNDLLPVSNIKNFSAPLVECMAETIKNMIQNRAGYTRCSDPDESPTTVAGRETCVGGYVFREGDRLTTPSPLSRMQDLLRTAVKLILTLSVVFLGYSTLLALKPVDKKTILIYVVKFGFVVYFALGTGWQDLFVDHVFKISSDIASFVTKFDDESLVAISAGTGSNRLDGCQFPKFDASLTRDVGTYPDAINDPFYAVSNPANRKYAPGFEYLKPWDTLDCKFVRAIGFGPDMTVPNLILTILAGLLTGGLGVVFVMFSFIFAFFYAAMIIRAIHIFLVSTIAIAMLIFISPITITAILFKKTKDIFDRWLRQLLGFIVQPAILFAYIAIFVAVMDYAAYGMRPHRPDNGGLTFVGDGLEQPKGTVCNGDANKNSLYCIFNFASFGSYSGLEPIGIIAPFLLNINKEKLNTIIEAGLLMFIFTKFMDKISDIAGELTGSKGIASKTPSAGKIAGKAYGIARGVQKRGTRVAGNAIIGGARKVGRGASRMANRGKRASSKGTMNAASSVKGRSSGGDSSAGGGGGDAARPTPPPRPAPPSPGGGESDT